MTYIVPEPMEKTVYIDNTGKSHDNRDDAIMANFDSELWEAIEVLRADIWTENPHKPLDTIDLFKALVEHRPDMVRAMLGDRDAT